MRIGKLQRMKMIKVKNTDEYISLFPEDIQKRLAQLRMTIGKAAPKSSESIKYGIPTFEQNGNLVHFAAYKSHIGFYPAPAGIKAFKQELSNYEQSKGAIRFSLDKPLPLRLISKIVKFRVKQNEEKAKAKLKKRPIKKR